MFYGTGGASVVAGTNSASALNLDSSTQKEAWLSQVKALEMRLQATLALGPDGVAAAGGVSDVSDMVSATGLPVVVPKVSPPSVLAPGVTKLEVPEATVETFSVCTPSVPCAPAPVFAPTVSPAAELKAPTAPYNVFECLSPPSTSLRANNLSDSGSPVLRRTPGSGSARTSPLNAVPSLELRKATRNSADRSVA